MNQRNSRPSVCFVTADFAGVIRNGGIGTHFWLMSQLLARRGWAVHVLFCGEVDDAELMAEMPERMAAEGITFQWLSDMPAPVWHDIKHYGADVYTLRASQHVLEALEVLHAEHRFDLIEFPDWGGLGLRSVQAKRSGLAFADVRLAVKLHSTTQWQREGNLAARPSPRDLKLEFAEQYAFEHADVQLTPSRYMARYSRELDWAVRDDVVVAYPYPEPEPTPTAQATDIREIAFFGRLERRKGLDIFLDALDAIPDLPVLFMGKDTTIDGRRASEIIADRLGDRPHRIETELNRDQAIAELQSGDRLAVIASKSETFGFTVAECVANRIPFLAASAGGVPEAVPHEEAHRRWLFEPTGAALIEALRARLSADGEREIALRAEVAETCDADRWNNRVEAAYRTIVDRSPSSPVVRPDAPETVSIAIAHYNQPQYLPAALASLAAQTRAPDEVLVMDDGSSDPEARRVFDALEAEYPGWTFLRQENAGPGAARNACLERASGTYFLPFDSDNIATPELVETYVTAITRDAERAAVTCHNLAFVEDEDIAAGRFVFRYAPTGGPRISGVLENVYGDTCAMFRADALRAVGGFENERWNPHEDWETMVKLALAGYEVEVVPRALFWYRTDSGGRLQALSAGGALAYRHRNYLVERFYADAELTRRERIDLWQCLIGFDYAAHEGLTAAVAWHEAELKGALAWHHDSMAELTAWHEGERLRSASFAAEELALATHRAELAEDRLAAYEAAGPTVSKAGPAGRASTADLVREVGRRGEARLRWWSERGRRLARRVRGGRGAAS